MIQDILKANIREAFQSLFNAKIETERIVIEPTKADFEGDFTFVVFPFLKLTGQSPDKTAQLTGEYLKSGMEEIESFRIVKGFLNLTLTKDFWIRFLRTNMPIGDYGFTEKGKGDSKKIVVEYSSPNTNKPLHLGHIRNNLLGYSVSRILKANGHDVFMCNLVNDRGIHICKSMLAWIKYGGGETPESAGMKGDHLVGKYYVEFDKHYKKEIAELESTGMPKEEAEIKAPSIVEAQDLLLKWEQGDPETVRIWKMMNQWVYAGFDITYKDLGVSFDKFYYESDTYLPGKEIVREGLEKNVFYKKEDGSIWIDLTAEGLDEKLLLRKDGTSVYMTQDLGTAELKYHDFPYEESIYVVGNEQDYHFRVLKLICGKLGKAYAKGIFHLSYGMVELPHGKMKSREGTVVDADDLIAEMIHAAATTTKELGKTEGMEDSELEDLYRTIALGAIKYFLLKVEPKKKMLFNPEESIDFHGNTGPFVQYTHARIQSILRNVSDIVMTDDFEAAPVTVLPLEKALLRLIYQYPQVIRDAGAELSPGLISNYVYELAKTFSQFYHELSIIREENPDQKKFRIGIIRMTARIIRSGFGLLGIEVPERM